MTTPDLKFRIGDRFGAFWQSLRSADLKKGETAVYLAGWLFALGVILFSSSFGPGNLVFLGLFGFFWYKLVGLLKGNLTPPNELLILILFVLEFAQLVILKSVYSNGPWLSALGRGPQFILLAVQIFLFSLILVRNSKGKRVVLLVYFILCWLAMIAFNNQRLFYVFLVQIILFIFLLRKTSWLEELTKAECWVYLIFAVLVCRQLFTVDLFRSVSAGQFDQPTLWFLMPRFLHAMLKMYLLAVVVKIPIVLVYNFAKLSGKLRISSLFQSSFPQFIQLAMLLIIFYFFVAGWQAEKVRLALVSQAEQTASGRNGASDSSYRAPMQAGQFPQPDGYQRLRAPTYLPEQGLVLLNRTTAVTAVDERPNDYFFFTKSSVRDSLDFLNLVRLDAKFLGQVTDNASILAGSALLGYPYNPPNWESFILQATLFDQKEAFRIFPFGLTPITSDPLVVPFRANLDDVSKATEQIVRRLHNDNQFSVGRIIAPVFNADGDQKGFFAFDILLLPDLSFFTVTLSSYLLLLLVAYTLVNIVVIRRMVKFGSEINRMIVQKFNQLRTGIRQIATGNLDYKVRVDGEDEFFELAEGFNQMGEKLKQSIAEAREKERLQQELTIARKVQLDMLPTTLPNIPGFKIAATLKTANAVGGDFYDILQLDDNQFLFTIGDVSGKSTSAAFYMAQCISLFRYSQQFTGRPREIAIRLNRYFSDPMIDRQIFVTAIIGLVDVKSGSLRFVRAGHPAPILLSAKNAQEPKEVKFKGLGIGLERTGTLFEKNLEDGVLTLSGNDAVVFYTDGVVEAARRPLSSDDDETEETEFYGEDQFLQVLKNLRGHGASAILEKLDTELDKFHNGQAPMDDYTLLVIQRSN